MAASKKNMNLNPLYSSLAKHGIFIDSTGQLQAWGDNQVGHLGIGNTQSQREPRPVVLTHPSRPGELIKVLSVSAGMEHTLLLSTEYEVFGWGSNGQGQLGVGAQTPASAVLLPIPMPTNKRIVQIACGSFYSAVLTEDGLVYTWGSNSCGQLGMRGVTGVGMSNRIQNYPVQVALDVPVVGIFCGHSQMFARTSDNKIYGWGRNSNCELGPNLLSDQFTTPVLLSFPQPIAKFRIGGYHCMVITDSGDLYTWGFNGYGTLGIGSCTNLREPTRILTKVREAIGGGLQCLAIREDGKLWAWGESDCGQVGIASQKTRFKKPQEIPEFLEEGETIQGIGCGNDFSWVITQKGGLYIWGSLDHVGMDVPGHIRKPTKHKMEVALPLFSTDAEWRAVFYWLFLGRLDPKSQFSGLPIEIVYFTTSVLFRYPF